MKLIKYVTCIALLAMGTMTLSGCVIPRTAAKTVGAVVGTAAKVTGNVVKGAAKVVTAPVR